MSRSRKKVETDLFIHHSFDFLFGVRVRASDENVADLEQESAGKSKWV
jgi:hypothetical protein